jgi:hypothetical protein
MHRTHRLAGVVVSGPRLIAPWLCVLALSAGLASAMTLAVARTPAERDGQASIPVVPTMAAPYVPDGVPNGEDAWAAAEIHHDPLDVRGR